MWVLALISSIQARLCSNAMFLAASMYRLHNASEHSGVTNMYSLSNAGGSRANTPLPTSNPRSQQYLLDDVDHVRFLQNHNGGIAHSYTLPHNLSHHGKHQNYIQQFNGKEGLLSRRCGGWNKTALVWIRRMKVYYKGLTRAKLELWVDELNEFLTDTEKWTSKRANVENGWLDEPWTKERSLSLVVYWNIWTKYYTTS